ncbi:MAG: AsmA family protein [bacterium]|nr:AsmA family protein [bacterium]
MRKIFIIVGIILGVLLIGLVILSTITFSHPKLKQIITAQAEKALERKVTIDDLRINLLWGIQLKRVTIANREGPGDFVKGEEFVLKYRLWPLLRRQFVIKKIVLNSPEIIISRNKEGIFNFQDILEAEQPEEESGFSLSIAQVSIKDGRAEFRDELVDKETILDRINLSLSGLSKAAISHFKMSMRVDDISEFKAQGNFEVKDESFDVALDLSRFVPAGFGPYYYNYLPFSLLAGEVSGKITLSGQLNKELFSTGEIIVDRATLVYPEKLKQPIKDIVGQIDYALQADMAKERLSIDKFQGKFGELTIALNGTVSGFSKQGKGKLKADLGFKDSKLALNGAAQFAGPQLEIAFRSENLNVDQLLAEIAKFKSSSSPYPEEMRLKGAVKVDEILYAGLNLKDLDAKINMPQGGLVKITEMSLKFGEGELIGSIEADLNQTELSSAASLNLRAINLASLSDILKEQEPGLADLSGNLNGNLQLKTDGMQKIDLSGKLAFTPLSITYVSEQTKFPLILKAASIYDLSADLVKNNLRINNLELILPESSLKTKGTITGLKEKPQIDLALVSEHISLAEIKGLIPPEALPPAIKELDLAGNGRLKGRLLGPVAQIKFESDLNLEIFELRHAKLPQPIKNLKLNTGFDLDLAKDSLKIKNLLLNLPESTLTLVGRVTNLKEDPILDVDIASEKISMAEIKGFIPLPGDTGPGKPASDLSKMNLSGEGRLRVHASGPISGIKLAGKIGLEDVNMSYVNLPGGVKGLRGEGEFEIEPAKEHLVLKELTLSDPGNSLALSGRIDNWGKQVQADLDFDLASKELNVDEILAALPAEKKVEGETVAAKPLGQALKGIRLKGEAKIERGVFKGVEFTKLKTDLEVVDGVVAVKDFKMNTWGGEVASKGEVNLKTVQPKYSLQTHIKGVETNSFLTDLTPMKDMIFGQLNFDLKTDGAGLGFKDVMKTISLEGDFEVIKGKLSRIKVVDNLFSFLGLSPLKELASDNLQSKIRIKQGKVELDSTSFKGKDVNFITRGSIGLDGSLDLDLTTEWADKFASKIKNPAISSLLKNEEDRVVLAFKVGGSYDSPEFKLSAAPLQEKLKQRMEEEKEKVKKQIEAEKEKLKGQAKEEVKKQIEESIPDEKVKEKVKDMMKIFKK